MARGDGLSIMKLKAIVYDRQYVERVYGSAVLDDVEEVDIGPINGDLVLSVGDSNVKISNIYVLDFSKSIFQSIVCCVVHDQIEEWDIIDTENRFRCELIEQNCILISFDIGGRSMSEVLDLSDALKISHDLLVDVIKQVRSNFSIKTQVVYDAVSAIKFVV